MTDSANDVRWDKLPHDPWGFFGLPAEIDRKDLKRAYNRLIRQFKPERFPAEFQRIRAAFEQLDLQLRYGQSASTAQTREEAHQWCVEASTAAAQAGHSGISDSTRPKEDLRQKPLHERIKRESLKSLYKEVARRNDKLPYDYYCLAIFSDLVDRQDGQQFYRWLLAGLEAHPFDHALLHLMSDYLRSVDDLKLLPNLLYACSKVIRRDDFFPLTEAAWLTLLREKPFKVFSVTLGKCSANLRDISLTGRIAFTIRMLRLAIWRDRSDWKDQAMDFIEQNFEQIPPHMEFDVDILAAAQAYVSRREQFINGDPVRYRIDQALEAYFTQDEVEGDRSVVECHLEIIAMPDELLAAFPIDENEHYESMYALWDWVSADVAERYGEAEDLEIDYDLWFSRCGALLQQCENITSQSSRGWLWNCMGWVYGLGVFAIYGLAMVLAAAILGILTASAVSDDDLERILLVVAITLGASLGILLGKWVTEQVRERLWFPFCRRMAETNYYEKWRREVLDFLDRSHLPFNALHQLIAQKVDDAIPCSPWVHGYVQNDCALAVYSLAQRFLV